MKQKLASKTTTVDNNTSETHPASKANDKSKSVTTGSLGYTSSKYNNGSKIPFREAPLSNIPVGAIIKTRTDSYKITGKIGSGGFGDVYVGIRRSTKMLCAVKVECSATIEEPRLEREYYIYLAIENAQRSGVELSNLIISYGYANMNNRLKFLFMPLLGPSLESALKRSRPTRSTCYKSAIHMCRALCSLHKLGFMHRDVKPANFAFETRANYNSLVLIDFGMATHFPATPADKPQTSVYEFIGTLRYAPRITHAGSVQSRADDLESWMYVAIEVFDYDALPWSNEKEPKIVFQMKNEFFSRRKLSETIKPFIEIINMISSIPDCKEPPYDEIISHLGANALFDGCRIDGTLHFVKRDAVEKRSKTKDKA